MARDDREHTFEKALARRLRADKSATSGAAGHRCADAEVLAAYHERQLTPEEMILWKEHISSCSRCQEILANIQATDAVPFNAADLPLISAEQKTPVLQIAKSRRGRIWLWTAPAGAIAAALLVWITLQQKPGQFEMAKNQPAASPLPRADSPAESAPASPQPEAKREAEKSSSLRPRSETSASGMRPKRSAEPTAPRPALKPPENERDDRALDSFDDRSSSTLGSPQAQGALSNRLKELSKKDAAAPTPPALMSESVTVNTQAAEVAAEAAAPSPSAKITNTKAAKAKTGMSSSPELQARGKQEVQQIGGMSRFSEPKLVLLANSKSPVTIATPNKKVSWRVGRAGSVEHTEDAGVTWSIQTSGVVNDLVAGSAPSDSVCWVVGQLGTILRTTDGGATWTKLQSPVNEDITSVFAVNPEQATISTAHASYQTADAGATWNKLPPE